MNVIAIFPNRDERTMVRSQLAKFGNVLVISNLREATDELAKVRQIDCIIIDDSAGDRALRRRWSDDLETDISTIDFLERLEKLGHAPLIMVCTSEHVSEDELFAYNELGADIILRRPYNANGLAEKLDEAYQNLLSPSPALSMWRKLRTLILQADGDKAWKSVEPLYLQRPDDARLGALFASLLLKSGTKEALGHAEKVLDALEKKLPNSISVKHKQFEMLMAQKNKEGSFDKSLQILELAPSNEALDASIALARELVTTTKAGARPYIKIIQRVADLPKSKKTLQAIINVSELLTAEIKDSDQVFQFIEAIEKLGAEPSVVPMLAKAVSQVEQIDDFTYAKIAQLAQMMLPGEPSTIERYFDILIQNQNTNLARQIVTQIMNAKNFSPNFFVAATRLALAQNDLKEASDMLHLGRKSKPSDDRWNDLAKDWKSRFEAQNKQA